MVAIVLKTCCGGICDDSSLKKGMPGVKNCLVK